MSWLPFVHGRQYTGAAETHINRTVPAPPPPRPHPARGACLLLADFPGPPDPLSVPLVVLAACCVCLFHFGEQLVFLNDAVHSCHVSTVHIQADSLARNRFPLINDGKEHPISSFKKSTASV